MFFPLWGGAPVCMSCIKVLSSTKDNEYSETETKTHLKKIETKTNWDFVWKKIKLFRVFFL